MERVATFLLEMDRRLAVAGMMALRLCRRDIGRLPSASRWKTVFKGAFAASRARGTRVFRRASDRASHRQRLRTMDA